MMNRGRLVSYVKLIRAAASLEEAVEHGRSLVMENASPLDEDELDDLIDLIQNMIDGEPRNPDVQAWIPVLRKFETQLAHLTQRRSNAAGEPQ